MIDWWLVIGDTCGRCGAVVDVRFWENEGSATQHAIASNGRIIAGNAKVSAFLTKNNELQVIHRKRCEFSIPLLPNRCRDQ